MSELIFTLARLGYLVLLWFMVFAAVMVIRRDVYGTWVISKDPRKKDARKKAAPAKRTRRPEPPTASALVVTEGPLSGSSLQLTDVPVLVGRSPQATLVLEDDYASAQHARIYPEAGKWFVEDLGSTNGTVVAGTRITGPTEIGLGTPIRIGQTILELRK